MQTGTLVRLLVGGRERGREGDVSEPQVAGLTLWHLPSCGLPAPAGPSLC